MEKNIQEAQVWLQLFSVEVKMRRVSFALKR